MEQEPNRKTELNRANAANGAPLLEIRNLGLHIGRRLLIRDLSLCINAGELWCILGANGVGKTLLLHTLVGLRKVERGSIRLFDKPLEQWPPLEAARLRGLLPQHIHEAFNATALEVALMGRHPHLARWEWERATDRGIAHAALVAMGVGELAERDVTTLSGGERQRVAIAALLTQDTALMLLDEPIAHLDLRHQVQALRHLVSLAQDRAKAIVFSIHDLNLARRFATHALLFQDGGAVDHGPITDVMNHAALSSAFSHPLSQAPVGARTIFIVD